MTTPQRRIEAAAQDASPSLARVGHWMAAHLIQTLSSSAEEIAELTGTSVAAINRFSRAAGFEGFSHLKSTLGKELESVVDPVHKLISAKGAATAKTTRGASAADEAIRAAAGADDVRRAAGRLMKARNVWVLGLGASGFIAGYAAHVLMPYLPQVWAVAGPGGTEVAARQLTRCGPGDVMLALSLPRYSTATLRLAAFAKERGVLVVAITDSAKAPLAAIAHAVLVAPSTHPLMPSSGVGALAIVEALATEVMRLNPDSVQIARELSQAVLRHLTTDEQSSGTDLTEQE
jgi:DNA-binding MurR/RpiR family transcriptional regulator